jgi:hypothetical protein
MNFIGINYGFFCLTIIDGDAINDAKYDNFFLSKSLTIWG